MTFPLYSKINSIQKRHTEGPDRGSFTGEWARPEFEYLADNDWIWREKVDGCLRADTKITMADYSTRRISQLREGDQVLGVDGVGSRVPTPVMAVHKNGYTDDWLNVRGWRIGAGPGGAFFSVYCTPDHRFFNPSTEEYVAASDLKIGMPVLALKSQPDLTPLQRSILLGKLLGDGSIASPSGNSWAVSWGHSSRDLEYSEWTLRAVGEIGNPNSVRESISGYGSEMVLASTVQSSLIWSALAGFHDGDRKIVPEWVADALDPISLAVWYMDDGSLGHGVEGEDTASFATNGFTESECKILQRGLRKLGIESSINNYGKGWQMKLCTDAAERLFLLVAPYVPPCMQRKLPARYRGGPGWLPPVDRSAYKAGAVQLVIDSITDGYRVGQGRMRHDITTGTHNYFAGGILVHNCNIRIHIGLGPMRAGRPSTVVTEYGGRTDNANIPMPLYQRLDELFSANSQNNKKEVYEAAFDEECLRDGITLFGEGYGAGIQKGGHYGPVDFILFDVLIGDSWMTEESTTDIAGKLGLKRVPIFGIGSLTDAIAMIQRGRMLSALTDQQPEGLVCVPEVPLFDRRGHRIVTKVKHKDFQ